jgi:hypothetical protein
LVESAWLAKSTTPQDVALTCSEICCAGIVPLSEIASVVEMDPLAGVAEVGAMPPPQLMDAEVVAASVQLVDWYVCV